MPDGKKHGEKAPDRGCRIRGRVFETNTSAKIIRGFDQNGRAAVKKMRGWRFESKASPHGKHFLPRGRKGRADGFIHHGFLPIVKKIQHR